MSKVKDQRKKEKMYGNVDIFQNTPTSDESENGALFSQTSESAHPWYNL